MSREDDEAKLLAYAQAFIAGYKRSVDRDFSSEYYEFVAQDRVNEAFPLYDRDLGTDVTIAVLTTPQDFYMFFLDQSGPPLKEWLAVNDEREFGADWTWHTPYERRQQKVAQRLGIENVPWLHVSSIPATDMLGGHDLAGMQREGLEHGQIWGKQHGQAAEARLPEMRVGARRAGELTAVAARYQELFSWPGTVQTRGQQFEILWRDVLKLYGWHPRKITIPGEDDDFTALREGLHILGEVRWYKSPMTGGKMREFVGKLDPRPQTVGLFISHSGYDKGAMSVLRRALGSKTVVLFDRRDIDNVLLNGADPGVLFDLKLRDTYDFLFEKMLDS